MDIACLDLGSNSFHLEHLAVAGARVRGSVVDEKRSVRLGESVFRTGGLDRATWNAGLTAFEHLLSVSREARASRIVAVATSAIRSARNGQDFLAELERRHQLPIELLAPSDEAKLAYFGALAAGAVGERTRTAVVDLGGGSAELTIGEGAKVIFTDSLPLGVLRVLQEGAMTADGDVPYGQLIRQIKLQQGRRLAMAGALGAAQVVLASGTARAVRSLAMAESTSPGKTGALSLQALQASLFRHEGMGPAELRMRGVDAARVDTILIAHAVLIAVMDGLGADRAHVTNGGIRHGLAVREVQTIIDEEIAAHAHEMLPTLAACGT